MFIVADLVSLIVDILVRYTLLHVSFNIHLLLSLLSERKISGGLQKAIDRNITTIDDSQGHIFISYQWSNQRALIDVRNELNKRGFKVMLDMT